jgi:DNA polymerase IV
MSNWEGRLILHIDADAFFASVEQSYNPLLRGKSVVVCGRPIAKGIVTAASYEAKKFGIKAGMPIFEAKKLLPGAIYIPVDIPKYLDFSTKLLKIYLQYTKILEPYSIDEVFLDLTGQYPDSDPEKLARAIKAQVKAELGVTVSVGIGPNKLIAKIASEYQKPDGLFLVNPKEVLTFLAAQPVESCPGIGPKTTQALKTLNVRTFADLIAIPEGKLRLMFGVNGFKLYLAARGIDDSPVIALDQLPLEKSMGHETTFPNWISSQEQIEGILWELSSKVAFRLRERKLLAQGVRIKIKAKSHGSTKQTYDKRFSGPTADDGEIAYLAVHLFLMHWNRKAVKGIGVTAFALVSMESVGEQMHLFPPDSVKGELIPAIDSIKQKYGAGIITRGTNLLASRANGKRGKTIGPGSNANRNLRLLIQ